MNQLKKTAKIKLFHPFLLGIYPILGLYGLNVGEAKFSEIYRPIIISIIITLLFLILIKSVLKDWLKSGLIISLTLLLFFSYGHIYNYLKTISFGDFVIGRHRFLLPMYILVFILGVFWVLRRSYDPTELHKILNFVMMIIMIFPFYQILNYRLLKFNSIGNQTFDSGFPQGNFESLLDYQPDVYFIVLDSYTRADTLEMVFGYDNQPFLNELKEIGFFVANCSQSNHPLTKQSLASALNMEFVQNIWQDNSFIHEFTSLVKESRFRSLLENQGYITVAFETGFVKTELSDADIYIQQPNKTSGPLEQFRNFGSLNNFEFLLFETTLLVSLNDFQFVQENLGFDPYKNRNFHRYNLAQFKLDILNSLQNIKSPKFVFLHIVPPHLPIIFDENGNYFDGPNSVNPIGEDFLQGYINQVKYLNSRIPAIMESLISESENPPIIILIGDHGAQKIGRVSRSTNLSAIYLPGGGDHNLYNNITPINIFKIISKYYFGLDSELVEDTHFNIRPNWPGGGKIDQVITPIEDPNEECNNKK